MDNIELTMSKWLFLLGLIFLIGQVCYPAGGEEIPYKGLSMTGLLFLGSLAASNLARK